MQENLQQNKEEISSETWMMILFLFAQSQEIEEQKQYGPLWDTFEEGITFKNRFFSDSPVIQEIEKAAEKSVILIFKFLSISKFCGFISI